VTILRSATDPRWVRVALSDLDRTLGDHAHCEKKAAATALKLVADHADRPELVRALAKLAQEETRHFLAVLAELQRRGAPLPPDAGDPYARALLARVRPAGPARLLDRLLASALIEARSCERLSLLGEALPPGGLRDLYRRLAVAEGGHELLFVQLAESVAGAEARERLAALADAEAAIVAALPVEPRIH
jgi:tRNA-(ms[2]io[6]A)-hydroxylase